MTANPQPSASPAERELDPVALEAAVKALCVHTDGREALWKFNIPDAVIAIRAYLAASAEGHGIVEGWRDISSAPKGERVWLFQATPGDYGNQQCAGSLRNERGFRRVQIEKVPFAVWREEPYDLDYWQCDLGGFWPTHWMPLAAAPTSTTREGEGGGT